MTHVVGDGTWFKGGKMVAAAMALQIACSGIVNTRKTTTNFIAGRGL